MKPTVADCTVKLGSGERAPRLRFREVRLTVTGGPDRGLSIVLEKSEVTVGKGPGNDLVLGDAAVSREHLSVRQEAGRYLLTDLGSTNGTRVSGVELKQAFVEPGQPITLGGTTLVLRDEAAEVSLGVSETQSFHGLLGASRAMRELFSYLQLAGSTGLSVVLQGETGSGKELVARALHQASTRAGGPFVVYDCGTADAQLIRAELFGHNPGAFTGAVGARKGAFQSAQQGVLFLDEIGELPLELQPMLLRALERREVQPLGVDAPVRVDVRVVCATHRNLAQMVQEGRFREDLLYRLAGVVLVIPPLRDRPDDVELLATHFLAGARPELCFTAAALGVLARQSWKGNVRELKNVVERTAAMARGTAIGPDELRLDPLTPGGASTPGAPADLSMRQAEVEAIRRALKATGGNRRETARVLGIDRKTLWRKLQEYGLED